MKKKKEELPEGTENQKINGGRGKEKKHGKVPKDIQRMRSKNQNPRRERPRPHGVGGCLIPMTFGHRCPQGLPGRDAPV